MNLLEESASVAVVHSERADMVILGAVDLVWKRGQGSAKLYRSKSAFTGLRLTALVVRRVEGPVSTDKVPVAPEVDGDVASLDGAGLGEGREGGDGADESEGLHFEGCCFGV